MRLYDKLKEYGESGAYPFHMPGHKRRLGLPGEILDIDITEIDGFDNLHHAEGVLLEAERRAAALYGSEDTYFLVNGSTAGILAAISACVHPGGKLLMARNSHKAAYHAAEVRGLRTVYLYPEQDELAGMGIAGSLSAEDVRAALAADREIEAVFITSPTYEGIVSDVAKIAELAHSFQVPLIVDEAHGAHFGFHPYFPESSVKLGADLVIHSLHKTLPSMTQTALLHRNGALVGKERIEKYLGIYQSSSPSYVLMASMDACIAILERKGAELFEAFAGRLTYFAAQAEQWKHIRLFSAPAGSRAEERLLSAPNDTPGRAAGKTGVFAQDASKLVLSAEGRSGKWLEEQLRRRFLLEMEMAAGDYVVALTSIADTDEGFGRLLAALRELDEELDAGTAPDDTRRETEFFGDTRRETKAFGDTREETEDFPDIRQTRANEQVFTIAQADERPQKRILLAESAGEISAEYIYRYPPGTPMLVPGERISRGLLAQIEECRADGLSLQGLTDHTARTIRVITVHDLQGRES